MCQVWDNVVSNRTFFQTQLVGDLQRQLDEDSRVVESESESQKLQARTAQVEDIRVQVYSNIIELYRRAAVVTAGETTIFLSLFIADVYIHHDHTWTVWSIDIIYV